MSKIPNKLEFKKKNYTIDLDGFMKCFNDLGQEMQAIKATVNGIIDYLEYQEKRKNRNKKSV